MVARVIIRKNYDCGDFLNNLLYESESRGTPDFPIAFYHVDSSHPRYHMITQWHNDIEINRVIKGKLTIRLNDEQFVMRENDSLIIPGGVIHSAEPEDCVYECIVFTPSVLYPMQRMRKEIKANFKKPVFLKEDTDINELFENIKKNSEKVDFKVMSCLYAVMYTVLSEQKNVQSGSSEYKIERIKPAISYIEENYMRDIFLSELAKECSMSPNYFCRFFKEVTGQTLIKYITATRIAAACEMLLRGASVTESALGCGFNDVSYFARVFKEQTTVLPKKYAEKYMENEKRQG